MEPIQAIAAAIGRDVYKIILSAPQAGAQPYRRVEINRLPDGYHVEKWTATQAFHEQIPPESDAVRAYVSEWLSATRFRQLHAWDARSVYAVRVTAKGKVLTSRSAAPDAPPARTTHNRQKKYLLPEGTVVPGLVEMGVMDADGRVLRPMQAKFRQINRFLEMVDDVLGAWKSDNPIRLVDFGCGKSYLTFVLYHYLTSVRGLAVDMTGLDLKADVIAHCNRVAARYGYAGLRFEQGDIAGYTDPRPLDVVVTLHACDTATDLALFHAIRRGARWIFAVPCCQHELNTQMTSETLGLLTRYGIVKERVAALMTDAIRGHLLECCGYRTQLLEFIEMEHTPKNILIRAARRPAAQKNATRARALAEVEALMDAFQLQPTLYRLLRDAGEI